MGEIIFDNIDIFLIKLSRHFAFFSLFFAFSYEKIWSCEKKVVILQAFLRERARSAYA